MRLTGGRGVHMVLDPMGGENWKKNYALLRPGGLLFAFGVSSASARGKRSLLRAARALSKMTWFSPLRLMNENRGVVGDNLGHLWSETELLRHEMRALLSLLEAGRIAPRVTGTFPFSRAPEAFARLDEGLNVGKLLLVPD
jgi:NADPH:quinone reductase-like Zn-dependent oxidoreductase